jgi:ankyrin repeat protein
LYSYHTLLS